MEKRKYLWKQLDVTIGGKWLYYFNFNYRYNLIKKQDTMDKRKVYQRGHDLSCCYWPYPRCQNYAISWIYPDSYGSWQFHLVPGGYFRVPEGYIETVPNTYIRFLKVTSLTNRHCHHAHDSLFALLVRRAKGHGTGETYGPYYVILQCLLCPRIA